MPWPPGPALTSHSPPPPLLAGLPWVRRFAHGRTWTRAHTQACTHTHTSMPSPSPHPGGSHCVPILQTRQRGGALCSHHVAPLGTWRAVRVSFSAGCSGLPWRGLEGLVPRSLAEWGASQPPEPPAFLFPPGAEFIWPGSHPTSMAPQPLTNCPHQGPTTSAHRPAWL